jgi:hypothetical protein
MLRIVLMFAAMSCCTAAHAQDCRAIQDSKARLDCFDKGTTPKAPAKKAATAPDEFADAKAAMSKKLTDPEVTTKTAHCAKASTIRARPSSKQ